MPCTSILRETSLYTERHKVTVHLLRVRVFCGKKVKEKVKEVFSGKMVYLHFL